MKSLHVACVSLACLLAGWVPPVPTQLAVALGGTDTPRARASSPDSREVRRVTPRPANPNGRVLILQYHKFTPTEERWGRTPAHFRLDLERLYRAGFRPVTMSEYLGGNMDLPPGASPVVFTFDDSHPSQFRLLRDGRIDPSSAVGVWHAFAKKHPDFPVKATWYVLPKTPFGQRRFLKQKLKMLRGWGSELGSHTMSHGNLSKKTDQDVMRELAESTEFIRTLGFEPTTLAYPYGIPPTNRRLARSFNWNGKWYAFQGAVLAGSAPAPSPLKPNRDLTGIPRVQGFGGEYGITWWLARVNTRAFRPYVAP